MEFAVNFDLARSLFGVMVVGKRGRGHRRTEHHVEFPKQCAPLLTHANALVVDRNPVAMAQHGAARLPCDRAIGVGWERLSGLLQAPIKLRRPECRQSRPQERYVDPPRLLEIWKQRASSRHLGPRLFEAFHQPPERVRYRSRRGYQGMCIDDEHTEVREALMPCGR